MGQNLGAILGRPLLCHLAAIGRRPGWLDQIHHGSWRVGLLLLTLLVLNTVDLHCTIFAYRIGMLQELNPLAARMLLIGQVPSLVEYKILLELMATSIFWRLRRKAWVGIACWGLVGVYAGLSGIWYVWSRDVLEILQAPGSTLPAAVLQGGV